jgi:IS5 family transposase
MREIRHNQLVLTRPAINHPHARELEAIAAVLDAEPKLAEQVHQDRCRGLNSNRGAPGMSGEQALRTAIIKQLNGFSYEMLAFHLADSASFRRFCLLPWGTAPAASTLQENITLIRPKTWQTIHQHIVQRAQAEKLEPGKCIRTDCTVTQSNIHPPDDAWQLLDTVRVLSRLVTKAKAFCPQLPFARRLLRARRRRQDILRTKDKKKRRWAYRDLIGVTEEVCGFAEAAIQQLAEVVQAEAASLRSELVNFLELGRKVIDQTRRRVVLEEKVSGPEKVVSLFEPHTDVIIKSGRKIEYGHKVCLSAGVSGLVVDVMVLSGNPADSTLVEPVMERVKSVLGRMPAEMAFDGGFASRANLEALKAAGVKKVCFSKRRGMSVEELAGSGYVYRRLWRFRAGVEGGISTLKRGVGLGRCTWQGASGFRSYVWSSVVAHNLLVLARHLLE